jgi:S1-C subfamily serine protease
MGLVIGAALAIPAWSHLTRVPRSPVAAEAEPPPPVRVEVSEVPRDIPVADSVEPPALPPEAASLEEIVARVVPTVASIQAGASRGTGFFVRADALVTNAHVVDGQTTVTLQVGDRAYTARVVSLSRGSDLAVLHVLNPNPDQPTVQLGSIASVRVGQEVIAVGSALGVLSNTVTRGIISALRQVGQVRLVQTDAAVNPGNSGGPLVDRQGLVIGINSMTVARQAGEGVAFAVAADHAVQLLAGAHVRDEAHTPLGGLQKMLRPPGEPVEDARDRGGRALAQALERAAQRADDLDRYWTRYAPSCLASGERGNRGWFGVYEAKGLSINPMSPYDCMGWLETVRSNASAIRTVVDEMTDRARRDGVYPGVIRELRKKHQLDWD